MTLCDPEPEGTVKPVEQELDLPDGVPPLTSFWCKGREQGEPGTI
jgi:hypothetical protein